MAAKRILRYLKGTKHQELVLRMCEGGVSLCAFSDAGWAGELTSRKSTSGVCVKLNSMSGCVCWTSKLQASVALSTAEAEVCGVLSELGVVVSKPVSVFVDNQARLALSKHSINHKTKHFVIKSCPSGKNGKKAMFYLNFYLPIEYRQIC